MCQNKNTNTTPAETTESAINTFDIEGHRGCRGLYPENTLPAFQKALELQVNTLELDLAVSADKQLVVSHEPYFRSGLSIDPDGNPVTKEDELNHNIYKMDYETVMKYDVGSLSDERYPERENLRTFKPLFTDVVNKAQHYAFTFQVEEPDYNIEIKRNPEYDEKFHPTGMEFASLVLDKVKELNIQNNTIIQSFDIESLQIVKAKNPDIRLALLIENQKSVADNITALGFKPDIYSCYFKLLKAEDITYCHNKGIKVIPWTVNEISDMQAMVDLGVDGLISDYPDRAISLIRK